MRRVLYFPFAIFLFILSSYTDSIVTNDKPHIANISSVYQLFERVDSIWPGCNNKEFAVSLIYYADSICYVVNPKAKFKSQYDTKYIFSERNRKFYRTNRIDSIDFHMHVGFSIDDDDSTNFNYFEPYMYCTSPELTCKTVPVDMKEWQTMVLHEMFHGFQLKHSIFINRFKNIIALGQSQSTLSDLYNSYNWYAESVSAENNYLLSALKSSYPTEEIMKFITLRNSRYDRVRTELDIDIKECEELFETMEGTARYVEVGIYPDLYDLGQNKWIWSIGGKNYFYSTGFNIARLLDKLEVQYKEDLFDLPKASLFSILSNITKANN